MAQARQGNKVKVDFVGKLLDGTIVDSTRDCDHEDCGCEDAPLEFTIGQEEVVPGIEEAIIGMEPGQSKTITIPAEQGYGPRDEELVVVVERKDLPEDLQPEIGEFLEVTEDDGEGYPVQVVDLSEETLTLDANHPLAGQDLVFELSLLEIVE